MCVCVCVHTCVCVCARAVELSTALSENCPKQATRIPRGCVLGRETERVGKVSLLPWFLCVAAERCRGASLGTTKIGAGSRRRHIQKAALKACC